jgi:hypothetical protein
MTRACREKLVTGNQNNITWRADYEEMRLERVQHGESQPFFQKRLGFVETRLDLIVISYLQESKNCVLL